MGSKASFSGQVEIHPSFAPRPQISHVVFDFDGTLSWLRHGWPQIMCEVFEPRVPLRNGESPAELRELLLHEVLALNGKASIHQMRRCAELVQERGGEAPSPEALLQEYQARLDAVIRERTEMIESGRAQRDDFVVWGARNFLEKLRARGLTLIVLSGTIEHRVKEEAALLDLERYFGAHIYGSTADAAQSSKRAVMGRLLREEQITGEHLLGIGDGPVEILLTKELGGLAVAVASDEECNGFGRVDPQKYKQLFAAGADILVPDYREGDALLCHMGISGQRSADLQSA